MRRLLVLLTVAWLGLLIYVSAASPPPAATLRPRPTPRIPNHVYYTKRCWPACHYDPKAVKPAPQPFTYDFDGALAPDWRWVNEDPAHWTLSAVPGALRILAQDGVLTGDLREVRNALVREAPTGHFNIIVKVTFKPLSGSHRAATFIKSNEDALIALGLGSCEAAEAISCVYFDGSEQGCSRVSVSLSAETVHLMLRKAGNSYIGYYRPGEGDWVEVGRCYNPAVSPELVGLAAVGGPDAPEVPADFDFFTLMERR